MYNVGQKIKFNNINPAMFTEGVIMVKFKVVDILESKDMIGKTIYYVESDPAYQWIFVSEDEIEGVI